MRSATNAMQPGLSAQTGMMRTRCGTGGTGRENNSQHPAKWNGEREMTPHLIRAIRREIRDAYRAHFAKSAQPFRVDVRRLEEEMEETK